MKKHLRNVSPTQPVAKPKEIPGNLTDPVHTDFRGEIHRHEFHEVKYNVLFTKAGSYRSGDYHPARQFDLILSGNVKLTLRQGEKDVVQHYGPNQLIIIPPGVPHLFKFVADCVMIEWWDAPFEAKYYEPYRKFITEQFAKHQKISR